MVRSQTEKEVLILKKKKAFDVVNIICKKRDIPFPSINFDGCSEEDEDQLAHYHPDSNTICISETQLDKLDFDSIQQVMAHEVSHILVQDHSPKFRDQEANSGIASFQPPPGVISTHSNQPLTKFGKTRKSKEDRTRCNYVICRKKTKLVQCRHCKNYYCKEHILPFEPSPISDRLVKTNKGHPCAVFADYMSKKNKEQDKRYSQKLAELTEKKHTQEKPKQTNRIISNIKQIYSNNNDEPEEEPSNIKTRKFNYKLLIIPAIIIILIVLTILSLKMLYKPENKVMEEYPEKVSFDQYLSNIAQYKDKIVVIKGYLMLAPDDRNGFTFYVEKVFDDLNKSIKLFKLPSQYKDLFKMKILSSDIYELKGTFHPWGDFQPEEILVSSKGTLRRIKVTPKENIKFLDSNYINELSISIKHDSKEAIAYLKSLGNKMYNYISDNLESMDIPIQETQQTSSETSGGTIDPYKLEILIHEGINQQRNSNGLASLSSDSKLSDIARSHSQDMCARSFFSHYTPEGVDPSGRASRAGYSCHKNYGSYYTKGIAENIFQNWLYSSTTYINGVIPIHDYSSINEIAQSTVIGWMNSPGHRQNILTSTYDREGIGVAICSNDKIYITENFC